MDKQRQEPQLALLLLKGEALHLYTVQKVEATDGYGLVIKMTSGAIDDHAASILLQNRIGVTRELIRRLESSTGILDYNITAERWSPK